MMKKNHLILMFSLISFLNLKSQELKETETEKNLSHQSKELHSSDYHQMFEGLRNSQIKFEHKKEGRVAFLGGSITYNPGWRDSVCAYLVRRFPHTKFEFVLAGIPSMGTTPAAFRLERDVLSKGKIDLLFEEAAVNDASNNRTAEEQIRGMEGIIRHLRISNNEMDIVMMHFVDPDKIASYNQGMVPEVISNHNQVAVQYRIPSINLAKEVSDRIRNKEFSWEADFKDLHPSPFGQGIYSRSMLDFLDSAYSGHFGSEELPSAHELPAKIDSEAYDKGQLIDISEAKFCRNWRIDSNWKPNDKTGTRSNYVNVPMLVSESPGSRLKLKFNGHAVGIAVAAGQDAGYIEYRIDKGQWEELNLFTKWSHSLHLPWYYTLVTGLSDRRHLLEIRVSKLKDENSNGTACRIRYFYVNQF